MCMRIVQVSFSPDAQNSSRIIQHIKKLYFLELYMHSCLEILVDACTMFNITKCISPRYFGLPGIFWGTPKYDILLTLSDEHFVGVELPTSVSYCGKFWSRRLNQRQSVPYHGIWPFSVLNAGGISIDQTKIECKDSCLSSWHYINNRGCNPRKIVLLINLSWLS